MNHYSKKVSSQKKSISLQKETKRSVLLLQEQEISDTSSNKVVGKRRMNNHLTIKTTRIKMMIILKIAAPKEFHKRKREAENRRIRKKKNYKNVPRIK